MSVEQMREELVRRGRWSLAPRTLAGFGGGRRTREYSGETVWSEGGVGTRMGLMVRAWGVTFSVIRSF